VLFIVKAFIAPYCCSWICGIVTPLQTGHVVKCNTRTVGVVISGYGVCLL
jgi:hypothetical protein